MPAAAAGFRAEFARHISVAQATAATLEPLFLRLVTLAAATLVSGGKLIFFGNGGSAADAQHLAAELAVRYQADRRALAAVALGSDGVLLTAAGNDMGFEHIFARQIEAVARPGDLAIALSTSGRSRNIIAGLRAARAVGLSTVALSGAMAASWPLSPIRCWWFRPPRPAGSRRCTSPLAICFAPRSNANSV